MNNNYLWDRSGNDPEIERLEDLLSGFRYEESEPPELPATNVFVLDKPHPGWSLRKIFAASAGLALVMLAGVWFRSGENPAEQAPVAFTETSQIRPSVESVDTLTRMAVQPDSIAAPAVRAASSRPVKGPARPRTFRAKASRVKNYPAPSLTAEERYAFGQLMLALSITGSKLRIVREMIDGTENTPVIDR